MSTHLQLIGKSDAIIEIKEQIKNIANFGFNILITGETGVGKGVIAKCIHSESTRSSGPMVTVNCAALPEHLIESELFGHDQGAFTGADTKRKGKFSAANNGILFLDEIGDLPLLQQSKLLHSIQSGRYARLGSDRERRTNAWIISATNKDLQHQIRTNLFRKDLYYRLNTIQIKVPALRERKQDIPLLINHFLKTYKNDYPEFNEDGPGSLHLSKLMAYQWPGNVRQLQSFIKTKLLHNSWEKALDELFRHCPYSGKQTASPSPSTQQPYPGHLVADNNNTGAWLSDQLNMSRLSEDRFNEFSLKKLARKASDRVEREVILLALEKAGWRKNHAAKMLKINPRTLLYKIKELDIKPPVWL